MVLDVRQIRSRARRQSLGGDDPMPLVLRQAARWLAEQVVLEQSKKRKRE